MRRIISIILILAALVCPAAVNRDYGRTNGQTITHAPQWLTSDLHRPTRAEYAAAGWMEISLQPPTPATNETVSATRYEARDGLIVAVYEYEPIPPRVVRYSKLRIITAAKARGRWEALKTFIEHAGAADEWSACQYIASDNAQFGSVLSALVAAGVATEDEIAQILAESEDEEW